MNGKWNYIPLISFSTRICAKKSAALVLCSKKNFHYNPQPTQADNTIANLKFILLLHAMSTMRVESNLFFMILKFNFDCFSLANIFVQGITMMYTFTMYLCRSAHLPCTICIIQINKSFVAKTSERNIYVNAKVLEFELLNIQHVRN